LGTELVVAYGVTRFQREASLVQSGAVVIGERLVDFGCARQHTEEGIALIREVLEVTLGSVDLLFGKPIDKLV
jgi:hypothetical protein